MEKVVKKEKKKITILGISIWEILGYFIIYSIAGYIIETLFALLRYGVFESRQSFLYGPFCSIYGIGAIIMILFLQYFQKNRLTLFAGGFIIGSITEYLVSLIGELILHVKWWDYSNMPLNINGRICLYYSFFWGVLAIFLMKVIQPHMRNFMAYLLKKVSNKVIKPTVCAITILMLIDCIISAYAINLFTIRMIAENNINVANKEIIIELNDKLKTKKFQQKIITTFFNDKKMVRTYPNLKVQQVNGTMVYFKDLLPDIKPYYFKFSTQNAYK
jgi:uncharacterized membrane protein